MADLNALARIQEAERLITAAIADVPLTCSAQDTAAAIQAIALKIAETCITPAGIARVLMTQAEGYLRTVKPEADGPLSGHHMKAHAILEQAVRSMMAVGLEKGEAGEAMFHYVATWMASQSRRGAAAAFYGMADTLAAPEATSH